MGRLEERTEAGEHQVHLQLHSARQQHHRGGPAQPRPGDSGKFLQASLLPVYFTYTFIHIWTVYNVHIINEIFIIFT